MLIDKILDGIQFLVMAIIVAHLWRSGRGQDFRRQVGWRFIFMGFVMILLGSLVDLTDEFGALDQFVLIGDTPGQALIEKLLGYLMGFVLLAIGFSKWLPNLAERERVRKELKVAHEELKEAHDELEARVTERTAELTRANNAKSEFLSNMSHELRTPLNSIIGFTNILLKRQGRSMGDEELEFLTRVQRNGMQLLRLINQLLDLSKVEAGQMDPTLSQVALNELVPETVNQLGPEFSERGVRLMTDLPDSLAPIQTDEGMLRQILLNLLGNALKFTAEGAVSVRVEADPESNRPARLEVSDTGIGIPPQQLATIFDAFQQVESGMERNFAGTGLGLTITKALCGTLGYDISVESELGRGSKFSIQLTPGAAEMSTVSSSV